MTIIITGASGLIGQKLTAQLQSEGHEVIPVSRRPLAGGIVWDIDKGTTDISAWEGADAIFHLAGENVGQRWSRSVKKAIHESRIGSTEFLAKIISQLEKPPSTYLQASAIGLYGWESDAEMDESAPKGGGFLAEVCQDWEAAAAPIVSAGIRTLFLRLGVVLSPEGGALAKMLPPFKAGVGGPAGSGQQMMSWITIDDVVGAFLFCWREATLSGAVNITAPGVVSNAAFSQCLASSLKRPALIKTPAFALKLLFGEMAEQTILASAAVKPQVLLNAGYRFQYPEIQDALQHLLSTD